MATKKTLEENDDNGDESSVMHMEQVDETWNTLRVSVLCICIHDCKDTVASV